MQIWRQRREPASAIEVKVSEGPTMPSTEVQLMGSAGVGPAQYGAGQVTAPSPRTMQEQGGKTQSSDGAQPASPQASRTLSVIWSRSVRPPSRWPSPETRLVGEHAATIGRTPRTRTRAPVTRMRRW